MNSLVAFDSSSAVAPLPFGGPLLELITFGISALVALVFVAYLLRCYFQEFWRVRRVQHRKRVARHASSHPRADRAAVIEECRCRRESAMASQADRLFPALDWRGLHALIPSHDRVTLLWDAGITNEGALPRFCVVRESHDDETITGNGEVTIR